MKFLKEIKEWRNEAVGILLAVLLFIYSPALLRMIDPTAGAYDVGILHNIVYSIVALLTFSFCSWIGVRLNFPEVFDYIQLDFIKDFKTLEKWQKQKLSLLLYFAYLALFVLIASSL